MAEHNHHPPHPEHAFEEPTPPLNAPRPLPPLPLFERSFTVHNPSVEEEDEEPEYMCIDLDVCGEYEYPSQHPQQHGRFDLFPHIGPSKWRFVGFSGTAEPVIPIAASPPPSPAEKKCSFFGRFFKGVKHLLKKMGRGVGHGTGHRVVNRTEGDDGDVEKGRENILPENRPNPTSPAYGGAQWLRGRLGTLGAMGVDRTTRT